MFTALYITVALLQFSIGQESIQYDSEMPQELDTPNENSDGDLIIKPMSVEGNDPTNNNIPVNGDNYEDEIGESIEPIYIFAEAVEQGQNTTATNYETEDSPETETTIDTKLVNEEKEPDEVNNIVKVIPKNTITVSGPVKAGGKVTILANFGCEDKNNGSTSSEEVPEVSEPISFNGCAKAQGKVTIAAHFGCGENIGKSVTVPETDSQASNEESDAVSFEGPVHAQGKVVVGSHYGCAPFGMPPVLFPWFPPFFHPQFYYPYPIPGFTTPYPYPIPGFATPYPYSGPGFKFQDLASEPGNQDFSDLPVASNLGNSVTGDVDNGIPFGGVVPASGTVSIAARF